MTEADSNVLAPAMQSKKRSTKKLTTAELFSTVFLDLKQKALKPELPGLASGFYDLDSLTQEQIDYLTKVN